MLKSLRVLPQYLLPQQSLSSLCGRLADNSLFYKPFIKWFIHHYKVNMSEALHEEVNHYKSFNDFFTRRLKPAARTIDNNEKTLISPVDGTISQIGQARKGRIIQAKGRDYSVLELLAGDTKLAAGFSEGRYATLYLSPKDYHRIHFPIDATVDKMIYVPGKLFAVKPSVVENVPNLFARNERLIISLNTKLGKVAFVMVGAMIVGAMGTDWHGDIKRTQSISTWTYEDNTLSYKKGDELGYFKLGSTVILLFENGANLIWYPTLSSGEALQLGQRLGFQSN